MAIKSKPNDSRRTSGCRDFHGYSYQLDYYHGYGRLNMQKLSALLPLILTIVLSIGVVCIAYYILHMDTEIGRWMKYGEGLIHITRTVL